MFRKSLLVCLAVIALAFQATAATEAPSLDAINNKPNPNGIGIIDPVSSQRTIQPSNIAPKPVRTVTPPANVAEPVPKANLSSQRSNDGSNGGPRRDDPGDMLGQFTPAGWGANQYKSPVGWDGDNERMWITNYVTAQVRAYSHNSDYTTFTLETTINNPGNCMDGAFGYGYLYINQWATNVVNRYNAQGQDIGNPIAFGFPVCGLAIDTEANMLFVQDLGTAGLPIHVFQLDGNGNPVDLQNEVGVIDDHMGQHNNTNTYGLEWVPKHSTGQLWMTSNTNLGGLVHQILVDGNWNCSEVQSFAVFPGADQPYCSVAQDGHNLWAGGYNPATIRIFDDGVAEGWIVFSPYSHNFGNVAPDGSYDFTFDISYSGNDVDIDAIQGAGGDFTTNFGDDVIDGSGQEIYTLTVTFTPNGSGNFGGELIIYSINPNLDPVTVALSGTAGTPPVIDVDASDIDFGAASACAPADPIIVTISNYGELPLNASIDIDPNDGQYTASPQEIIGLQSNSSENVTITFTPLVVGSISATLTISSNDPATPSVAIQLTGEGLPTPEIEVSEPNGHDFGDVAIGSPATWNLLISNLTGIDLHIDQINPSNGIFLTDFPPNGGVDVNSQNPLTVQVTFTPDAEGPFTGSLHIYSNDCDESDLELALTGNGIVTIPEISVSVVDIDFDKVELYEPLTLPLQVSNQGTGNLYVTGLATSDQQFQATFVNFDMQDPILPGDYEVIEVTFTPTAKGPFDATLEIESNDYPDSPLPIFLHGKGVLHKLPTVILGLDGVDIGQSSRIGSGDIWVNNDSPGPFFNGNYELTVGMYVAVTCASIRADKVWTRWGSAVTADVYYKTQHTSHGTIYGTTHGQISLPLIPAGDLPDFPAQINPGNTDKIVAPGNQTYVIQPGVYGLLRAGQSSRVTFTGGDYVFSEINGRPAVAFDFNGPTTIKVLGRIEINGWSSFGPGPKAAPGTTAKDIEVYVAGQNGNDGGINRTPTAVMISGGCNVRANIYAPNGTIVLGGGTPFRGSLIGRWVVLSPGARAEYAGSFKYGGHKVAAMGNPEPITISGMVPDRVELVNAYPNPFNATTTIKVAIPEDGLADLAVFDLNGRLVSQIVNGELTAGYHQFSFGNNDLITGTYIVRLKAHGVTSVQKVTLIK